MTRLRFRSTDRHGNQIQKTLRLLEDFLVRLEDGLLFGDLGSGEELRRNRRAAWAGGF